MLMIYLSMLSEQSDIELFEEMYHTHKKQMFYMAFGILHDVQLAENIVHDAFLTMIEQIGKFSGRSCPQNRALIDIIVIRKSINELNRVKRNEYVDDMSEIVAHNYRVDDEFISKDGYNRLLETIQNLDEKYSSILLLCYVQKMKPKQAAELLGITEENAKKRLTRAKHKLKTMLEVEPV